MSKLDSNTSRVARAKQLILGTQKHYPNGSQQLSVGGATFTVTALTALMQSFVDGRAAVDAAKATATASVAADRAQAPSKMAVMSAFETVVRGTFGNSADVLADFGLTPRKRPTPLTAEQKAVAVAKRAATRAARHTMGTVQKKDIKGNVSASLVVTSPAAAPTATPPAPGAPAGAPSGSPTAHSP